MEETTTVEMKFSVGQRVIVLPMNPDDPHDIPPGTLCEINAVVEDWEFPYELLNTATGEVFGAFVREDEIEAVPE